MLTPSKSSKAVTTRFLVKAKASLKDAVTKDRLSVLMEPDTMPPVLRTDHISPRNTIPENYRLCLIASQGFKCKIQLRQRINEEWKSVPLPQEEDEADEARSKELVIDALINVRRSLQCCSIAFEGSRCLYQTSFAKPSKDDRAIGDDIFCKFMAINRESGDIEGEYMSLVEIGYSGATILGFNQNQRMLLLENHVRVSSTDQLLFDPLLHYVCGMQPVRLLRKLSVPPPETFEDLNSRQQLVAHPLSIKTAMECAGPPGTGKTKVITELIRAILYCTEFHVVILSERNGAIDAIAEKMAKDCISNPQLKRRSVMDFLLWSRILSFGSSGMGSFSRLFLLEEKMK